MVFGCAKVCKPVLALQKLVNSLSGCLLLRQHAFYGIHDGLRLRVNFNVDAVAHFAAAEQRALQGFGDKVDAKLVRGYVADGEAASV